MKKIMVIAAVLCLAAISFSGCSKKSAGSDDDRPTVRLVTDATGIDDKSFNAAAWRGILAFYGDTWEMQAHRGTLYENITCQTQDMYIPVLRQISDEAPDLIIVTGFTFADALTQVAQEYPAQKYMIVDFDWVGLPNVVEFIFTEEQGSFLVGAAAALQAKEEGVVNPRFGFIGGVPGATITKFEMGFIQGLHAVIPDAEVVDFYTNDWGAPQLAKTQAKNWYDSGVYAIYSAAGGSGNGTIAQAREYRSAGRNVWAIGVDSDQYEDGLYLGNKSAVLTSMVKRVETASLYALNALQNDTFTAGVVQLRLANNGVDFSQANASLSRTVVRQLEDYRTKIINGDITVIGTYRDALAQGLVPATLGARD